MKSENYRRDSVSQKMATTLCTDPFDLVAKSQDPALLSVAAQENSGA